MNPSRFLRAFATSFILIVLLDGFWHDGLMADFYMQRLAMINPSLMGQPITFTPFIIFIAAINAVTMSYLILTQVDSKKPLRDAAWIGMLLGFTVSGTLNFLNHTLIVRWDIVLALVDTAWGTVTGLITALAIASVCSKRRNKGLLGMMRR
ncbi:DUF2177 family protein [Candidatus Peribacteria bacterium]|nr:DUF2177 family protein [Candidatus Peribacteria bacterium]